MLFPFHVCVSCLRFTQFVFRSFHFVFRVRVVCLFVRVVCFLHGRPRRILLDALPDGRIVEDVDTAEIDALCLQGLDNLGAKAAHGHGRVSLHVQHDRIRRDVVLDHLGGLVPGVFGDWFGLRGKIVVGVGECASLFLLPWL